MPKSAWSVWKTLLAFRLIKGENSAIVIEHIKQKEECFIRYSNTEKWVEKTRCNGVLFNQLQSVWISDETLFQMFGTVSQRINNS